MEAWRDYRSKSKEWVRRFKKSRRGLSFDTTDQEYRRRMHEVLLEHKFSDYPNEYFQSPRFPSDLTEEQYRRVDRLHACLVPWVRRVFNLTGARVIEVGSGTGSATLAFAPYVSKIHCFETDANAATVARTRLSYWGMKNISWEEGLFDHQSPFLAGAGSFDVVLLIAVLEHLYFHELKEILSLSFERLRRGGIIIVADTPNRLSVTDFHTSWINFFQWLPREVALEYYRFSPRPLFVYDIERFVSQRGLDSPETTQQLIRWGRGVSYHDFELALGREVHDMIVLDGWEEEVRPLAPVFKDDDILTEIFRRWEIKANAAFSRSRLHFVIRKPG